MGLVFLASFLAFLGPPASAPIPFTYFDNRMLIRCTIDGRQFTTIVDTGDPGMTITPETARTLGLRVRSNGAETGAGNRAVTSGATTLASLRIGPESFTNIATDVVDLGEIRRRFHFPHLDGIVGYSILQRFAVRVDVDSQTIVLERSAPVVPGGATQTAFTLVGTIPEIAAKVDGVATTVVIDTGDRSSLTLFGPFARANGFYDRYPSQRNIITGYGLGGPIYADVFRLPSVEVLGMRLTQVVTRASRQTGGAFTDTQQGGSIGTGILKRFNIVYDYPRHRMYSWPSKLFASPDRFVAPG
ncbi:MAG: aspartyl protease family protein [Candidatus Eremiobacteraeota bacterium]|nr:aspartyl protease family protein [Candidatus Eremiobacteraeota bacterium]